MRIVFTNRQLGYDDDKLEHLRLSRQGQGKRAKHPLEDFKVEIALAIYVITSIILTAVAIILPLL